MLAAQAHEIAKLQRQVDSLERENEYKSEMISVLVDKVERLRAAIYGRGA